MLWLLVGCADPPLPPPPLPASPAPVRAEAPPASRELGALRIAATGDVLLHESVQRAAGGAGWEALFAATRGLIEPADVAFANLETPVAPATGAPIVPMKFNAPPEALSALGATGFDVVSFANNHVYDQGRAGFVETLDHLDAAELPYVGAGRTCAEAAAARTFTHDGVTVAFLGTSRWFNDRLNEGPDAPCADTFHPDRADALIARARAAREAGADAVILSIHWGEEYAGRPDAAQVATAHQLVEGGFDVILGHHTHVLGPIEVVHAADGRTGVIAYSLGNYVSNQSAWYEPGLNPPVTAGPRDGVVLSLRVVRRAYGQAGVERVELADLVAAPLWTTNDATVRAEGATPRIAVEPLADRLGRVRAAFEAATAPDEVVALGREVDELERRWAQVSAAVGEQFLVPR